MSGTRAGPQASPDGARSRARILTIVIMIFIHIISVKHIMDIINFTVQARTVTPGPTRSLKWNRPVTGGRTAGTPSLGLGVTD